MQDQEQAAGHPGPSVVQSPAAEQEHSKLSPGREGEEAPSRVVRTHPEERTLSMQTPEPAAAELLLLGQDSGQGAGQLAGQAASLSVQAVHALGTELCAKVRILLVPGTAMASEMLLCSTSASAEQSHHKAVRMHWTPHCCMAGVFNSDLNDWMAF